MAKFHVSDDGVVRKCRAKTLESCPVKSRDGNSVEHFSNEKEAWDYSETALKEKFGEFKAVFKGKLKALHTPAGIDYVVLSGLQGGFKNSSIRKLSIEEQEEQLRLEEEYYQNVLKNITPLKNMDSPETKALKVLSANDLAEVLLKEAEKGGYAQRMRNAIRMATILHENQTRLNRGEFEKTPYIEHPLRNAVRISRWGVTNEEILTAAVLHDTLEDSAEKYVELYENENIEEGLIARGRLSKELGRRFGGETLRLVEAVTNDYQDSYTKLNQSLEEKSKIYAKKVDDSLVDASIYLVKLSDFVDNATGLYHNDRPERREKIYRMAYKYLPVVDTFMKKLPLIDGVVDAENTTKIKEQLGRTRERLEALVERGL